MLSKGILKITLLDCITINLIQKWMESDNVCLINSPSKNINNSKAREKNEHIQISAI